MRSGFYNGAAASHHHVMLLSNYRSHAKIIELSSKLFYCQCVSYTSTIQYNIVLAAT